MQPVGDYDTYVSVKRARERLGMQPAAYAAQLRQLTQDWLQQLAVLLQPVRWPPSRPNSIKLVALKAKLPLPGIIVQYHGSMVSFVEATPELEWAETNSPHKNFIYLAPKWHEKLLQAAERAARSSSKRDRSARR